MGLSERIHWHIIAQKRMNVYGERWKIRIHHPRKRVQTTEYKQFSMG